MNASLAVRALQMLPGCLAPSQDALCRGLEKTKWPGRMEAVLPGVILDGAHNEDGVARFVESAAVLAGNRPVSLLFSAVSDKDYPGMIRRIVSGLSLSHVTVTQVGGTRMVPARKLARVFMDEGLTDLTCEEDPARAFRTARARKGKEELLFCVGSLYLAGVIRQMLGQEH